MNNLVLLVFQWFVFIFSVMIHEVSHGLIAERLGDPTARLEGRLTFNPLRHIDPFGSIVLPLSLFFLTGGSFVFGWAKPVPYNPYNLKNPKAGAGEIAAAGPASNLLVALVFGLMLRVVAPLSAPLPLAQPFSVIVEINILLAVFNLVPLPPLDGSKVLFALLPRTDLNFRIVYFLERYGFILLLVFIFFGFQFIIPVINVLYVLIAGQPLPVQ